MPRHLRRIPNRLRRRPFRLYGIGLPRTGTTTLAEMFGGYRAAHEFQVQTMGPLAAAVVRGEADARTVKRALRQRDRMNLTVDSAHFLSTFVDQPAMRSDARFVLTLREPRAWVRSLIEREIRYPTVAPYWEEFREAVYGPAGGFPAEEAVLVEAGVRWPLTPRLRRWTRTTDHVVATVPAERLLIVHTEDLDRSVDRLAGFVGVDPATIRSAHANGNERQTGVIDELPAGYLDALVDQHCSRLLAKYFPDAAMPVQRPTREQHGPLVT
jgi:hypothetical protein